MTSDDAVIPVVFRFDIVWEHLHQLIGDGITIRTLDSRAPNVVEWSPNDKILLTPLSTGHTHVLGASWLRRTWEALAHGKTITARTIPIKEFSSAAMALLANLP